MVHRLLVVLTLVAGLAVQAQAAGGLLGGGLGGIGSLPGGRIVQGPLNTVDRSTESITQGLATAADNPRRDVVGRPLGTGGNLGRDEHGARIVKDELLAVSPSASSLAIAQRLNFTVLRQESLAALGLSIVTLQPPAGMTAVQALAALRRADPAGTYDYAHVYGPSGEGAVPAGVAGAREPDARGVRIGMIDGGVQVHHPALLDGAIVARDFASAASVPTRHGTAVASLLIGDDRRFSGYLPHATLYAADVFGGVATGGTAADIARALDWLSTNQVPVTNISLTGPNNLLLAAAVRAFIGGGHILVAPVGNDGPAAPLNYPAAYAGVISVTSVDSARRLQLDASTGVVPFAALGVDVRVASLPRGYAKVTGTSYAAPVVAARLALMVHRPDGNAIASALEQLRREAIRLPACGCGYVGPPSATLTAGLPQ
jgi:Subtilase family